MKKNFLRLFFIFSMVFSMMPAASLMSTASAAEISEHLSYFNGAIDAFIQGPAQLTSNRESTFTVTFTDANKNPYVGMTAKWATATVAMTEMDMGSIKAKISDVLDASGKPQGIIKVSPTFTMSGAWKLNLSLRTAAGSETHAITFDVAR